MGTSLPRRQLRFHFGRVPSFTHRIGTAARRWRARGVRTLRQAAGNRIAFARLAGQVVAAIGLPERGAKEF